jgi:hypothetical protein
LRSFDLDFKKQNQKIAAFGSSYKSSSNSNNIKAAGNKKPRTSRGFLRAVV